MNLELLLPALQKMPALPQNTPADLGTSGFAQTMAAFQATAGSDRPQAPLLPSAEQRAAMANSSSEDQAPLSAMLSELLPGNGQPLRTLTDGDLAIIADRLAQMAVQSGADMPAEAAMTSDALAINIQTPLEHFGNAQPALTAKASSTTAASAGTSAVLPTILENGQARSASAGSAALADGKSANATTGLNLATADSARNTLSETARPIIEAVNSAPARTDAQLGAGNLAAELKGGPEFRQDLRLDGIGQQLANQSTPANTAASAAPMTGSITAPLHAPSWAGQLGQQVITMGQRGGEQLAELRLNPHDLGPLTISLKITEHGAQAQFLSANAAVRQAVEQAIPQLRDALAEQGISLGDTSVGEHRQQQEQQNGQAGNRFAANGGATEQGDQPLSASSTGMSHVAVADGRVDLYA